MQDASQGTWITLAIVAVVVLRFLARELRDRKVPLNRLWLVPVFVVVLSLFLFYQTLSIEASLLPELIIGCVAGIITGAAIGVAVDRFTALRLTDDGRSIIVRGSMITVGIWVGALLLRLLGRVVAERFSTHTPGMMMLLNTAFLFVIAAAVVMVRWRYQTRVKALRSVGTSASYSGAP